MVLKHSAILKAVLVSSLAHWRRDRDEPAAEYGSSPDSPLEGDGFELHSQIRRHPARPAGARSRAARGHARRVVVAIDPAVTSGEEADETGIIVAGKDHNGHGYVLADLSGRYLPTEWARLAITAYRTHRADRIVAEVNNGGDMVGATLRADPTSI